LTSTTTQDSDPSAAIASGSIRGFCEVTLQTTDPEGLARFYRDAFGFEELARESDRIWLGVGGDARLGLWTPGEKEFRDRGGVHVHFALAAEPGSLGALLERLRSAGVEPEGPVEHPGGDRSIYARDPEGNVVEAWDFFVRGATTDDLKTD
jgi:catechol-2,3-dioxygenase